MSFTTPMRPIKKTMMFDSPSAPRQPKLDRRPMSPSNSIASHFQPGATPRKASSSPYMSKTLAMNVSPLKFDVKSTEWALVGTGGGSSALSSPGKSSRKDKVIRSSGQADRFIPNRKSTFNSKSKVMSSSNGSGLSLSSSSSVAKSCVDLSSTESNNVPSRPSKQDSFEYQTSVAEACGLALNTRILEFQPVPPQSSKPVDMRNQYNRPLKPAVNAQMRRKVPTAPERVLDAPGLIDDYYLNLLDWSSGNQVAIALESSVYIWNANTGTVSSLMESGPNSYISGIKWTADGSYLSVGFSDGDIQIWDVEERSKLRTMQSHTSRVGVMSWDKHLLSSGSRDGSIHNHDVRIAEHKVSEFNYHSAEVCGLEWRSDGTHLASGGNDNIVNIWDARSSTPKFTKTNHKAAVKALAWCPWQLNLLSTGGGSQDKHIHFWNSTTGSRVNSIDTGSQVTALRWSPVYKEIVSSHGFPNNHLTIWSYPSLTKNIDIVAHDSRVLHAALSPDGQTLATCASDENLKFWKIFESVGKKIASGVAGSITSGKDMGKVMMIR